MNQAAQLLFGIMAVGDDRAVDETWVMGQRAYKKAEGSQVATSVQYRSVQVRSSTAE